MATRIPDTVPSNQGLGDGTFVVLCTFFANCLLFTLKNDGSQEEKGAGDMIPPLTTFPWLEAFDYGFFTGFLGVRLVAGFLV